MDEVLKRDDHELPDPRAPKRTRLAQELKARVEGAVISTGLTCSICLNLFEDPHLLQGSSQSYCKDCITAALRARRTCPLTGIPVDEGSIDSVLQPNHAPCGARRGCVTGPSTSESLGGHIR